MPKSRAPQVAVVEGPRVVAVVRAVHCRMPPLALLQLVLRLAAPCLRLLLDAVVHRSDAVRAEAPVHAAARAGVRAEAALAPKPHHQHLPLAGGDGLLLLTNSSNSNF